MSSFVKKVTINNTSRKLWNLISPLDMSFLSPKVDAFLTSPSVTQKLSVNRADKEQDKLFDQANTESSFAKAWKQPESVRRITLPSSMEDSTLFSHSIKLNTIDEENMTLSFQIIDPPTHTSDVYTLKMTEGEEGRTEVELVAEGSEFINQYGEMLLSSLDRAFSSVYPYVPRRAVVDEYVTTSTQTATLSDILKSGVTPVPNSDANLVTDSYRWLEDPNSPETVAFVEDQNVLTKKILDTCEYRDKIQANLMKMFSYARYSAPRLRGQHWYFSKNDGLQNQAIIYQSPAQFDANGDVIMDEAAIEAIEANARVFIDPSAIDKDGKAALGSSAWSPDQTTFAYGVNKNGSDWTTIYVMTRDDAITTDSPPAHTESEAVDVLEWVKFTNVAWTHDNKGFFYCRYPAPSSLKDASRKGTELDMTKCQSVYYHKVGTPQSEDICMWREETQSEWMASLDVSNDGQWIMCCISDGCDPVNMLWVAKTSEFNELLGNSEICEKSKDTPIALHWARVVNNMDAKYDYIDNKDDKFVVVTNKDAPRSKIVQLSVNDYFHPATSHIGQYSTHQSQNPSLDASEGPGSVELLEVLPEHAKGVLNDVVLAGDNKLICVYNIDVMDTISTYTLSYSDSAATATPSPALTPSFLPSCASLIVSGKHDSSVVGISVTSPVHPNLSYIWDVSQTHVAHSVFKCSVPEGFDPEEYTVEQHFYPSADGTKIPILIMHRQGLEKKSDAPVYLYAYGGFNVSITPSFSVARCVFAKHFDGVVAIANIRGGGEYGDEWHKQGTLLNKQNVFDDFAAAAKYLINEKYTVAKKIAIHGGSNGGLLVAASVNQQPQLFGAAVAAVGVLDMLRFHKFTIGYAWCTDYGCSENNDEQFKYLHGYSPLHNVPSTPLPALMLTTADHDDRVVPAHSLKYISQAQRVHTNTKENNPTDANPLIIRIDVDAGHGAGKPLAMIMQESSDVFGFIAKYTGAVWRD